MSDEAFVFTPTLWAGAILSALQKKTVFEALCNKDFIGEVKNGNALNIATVNNPSVKDYTKGSAITYDEVKGTEQKLNIDQQKYFAFKVDDIDKVQSSIDLLGSTTQGAGFELADTMDLFLASTIVTDGKLKKTISATSILAALADVVEAMDNAKSPDFGRWLVIPPSLANKLTLELVGKLTSNNEIVSSGYIGTLFGLNIYKSINITKPICGNIAAITAASQIENVENLRLQNTFATGVRGLHVYGAKVTRPELCGEITLSIGATSGGGSIGS